MGAKVTETFLSRSMLEIDVRNIAEDIAASTVPLAHERSTGTPYLHRSIHLLEA